MHWRNALAAGAFAALLTALPAHAQDLARLPARPAPKDTVRTDTTKASSPSDTAGDTVTYSAVRIRFRGDHFSLSDKAVLKYKGTTLTADSIVYYSGDDLVEASGAPLIEDPADPPILGYRMRYSLKNHVGTVYYGSSRKATQSFNGMEIRREPDGDVYVARGEFTTCDLPDPHYYFYARRMIVKPESEVLSGPVVMDIADVPVAVLPMMVVPLGKGRRSGLLQPKFGGDQSQGFYLSNLGYYWALNDYMDFLLSGDIFEGQSGTFDNTDLNATYSWNKRYVWSGSITDKTIFPQFNPGQANSAVDFTNDLNLTPDQRQTLKGSGHLTFGPDRNAVQDNALTVEDALQQTANADLGYRRQFDWSSATLNIDLAQDYNLTENQLDRSLPNIAFSAQGPLIPASEDAAPSGSDPWYRKLNWTYNNLFNVDQVSDSALGGVGGDTSVYAGYSDALSLGGQYTAGYINLKPSVNFSQLWSLDKATGDTARPHRVNFDPSQHRLGEYFAAWNTGVTADTRLFGIAQAGDHPWFGRLAAIRHTLTPSVTLTYAPKLDSNHAFYANPKVGGTAFQAEQRTVGFGLGNNVDLKLADPAQPKQKPESYSLLATTSTINYNFANHTQPWSAIQTGVQLYLTKDIALSGTATHILYDSLADTAKRNQLTSPILQSWAFGWRKGISVSGGFNSGLQVVDAQGNATDRFQQSPWGLDLNYSFTFNATRVGTTGTGSPAAQFFGTSEIYNITRTDQATASLKINPTPGWKMTYDTQFDFTQGRFSSQVFGFERTLHCWQMQFNWTPVGVTQGWNFVIRIIDLPDVKLQTSDTRGLRSSSQ